MLTNSGSRLILRTQEPDASTYASLYASSMITANDIAAQDANEHQYAVLHCDSERMGLFSMIVLPWPAPLPVVVEEEVEGWSPSRRRSRATPTCRRSSWPAQSARWHSRARWTSPVLIQTITVGQSTWQLLPARATLEHATAAIRANPTSTHCGAPTCARCTDAVAGGPRL
jgi:hypothetical protein